ncbi:hydrolase [Arthrobacter sp. StoSoilB3]|nr:hydrolase [Arthrobacter sp. StoSoilB3]
MRISIGQLAPGTDKTANLAAIAEQAAKAAREGAALVVFPEMAMFFKHGLDEAFAANAESIPGPFTVALDGIAKKSNIAIVAGILETVPGDDRPANTLYATSSEGEFIASYRKVHLYDAFGLRESDVICPAAVVEPVVFELGGLNFGLLTCYDLRFPESARVLVDRGADVLVLPSAWTPGVRKEDHWETLVRARAIENTGYVIAANQAPPLSTGGSLAVDPMGIILAELGEQVGLATVEVIKERIDAVRSINPCLVNRRFRVEPVAIAATA